MPVVKTVGHTQPPSLQFVLFLSYIAHQLTAIAVIAIEESQTLSSLSATLEDPDVNGHPKKMSTWGSAYDRAIADLRAQSFKISGADMQRFKPEE